MAVVLERTSQCDPKRLYLKGWERYGLVAKALIMGDGDGLGAYISV